MATEFADVSAAVVAVTAYQSYSPVLARWRGLPVFSAWITKPEEADEPAQ